MWGPYIQFLKRLIMLMAKKSDLPDKIIRIKESLKIVKELIGFSTSKLKNIQEKMKFMSWEIEPNIPFILDVLGCHFTQFLTTRILSNSSLEKLI
jgi:hypothetical protein